MDDFDEILDMALNELTDRACSRLRKENPEADQCFKRRAELSGQAEAAVGKLDQESQELLRVYQEQNIRCILYEIRGSYLQGMKDCIALMKKLGML